MWWEWNDDRAVVIAIFFFSLSKLRATPKQKYLKENMYM